MRLKTAHLTRPYETVLWRADPVTAQVRRFESLRFKDGHRRAKRAVMLREHLLGRRLVWHDEYRGWVSHRCRMGRPRLSFKYEHFL
jgi:hypothetical protein